MKVTTESCLFGAWVASLLKAVIPAHSRALDVGTGTGLLSLILAQELNVQIDAVEIENGAAADAKENFEASPFRDRLGLHYLPIQEFPKTKTYGLVITNPPFYENSLKARSIADNMARHDQGLALDALFDNINRLIGPETYVAMLYPAFAATTLREKAKRYQLEPWAETLVHQTPKHDAFRVMYIFKSRPVAPIGAHQIFIKSENGGYSDEFIRLLRPFYLAL